MRHLAAFALLLLSFAGCSGGKGDIVVINKEIRREALSQTVAGDQFGSAAGSVIENTVVGEVQNKGTEEARNVRLTFHVNGGGQNFALVAHVPSIPAGTTARFQTEAVRTPYTLQFRTDGEVEIAVGKQE